MLLPFCLRCLSKPLPTTSTKLFSRQSSVNGEAALNKKKEPPTAALGVR